MQDHKNLTTKFKITNLLDTMQGKIIGLQSRIIDYIINQINY